MALGRRNIILSQFAENWVVGQFGCEGQQPFTSTATLHAEHKYKKSKRSHECERGTQGACATSRDKAGEKRGMSILSPHLGIEGDQAA